MNRTTRVAMSAAVVVAVVLATGARAWAQSYSTPVGCNDCINYWYYVDHGGNTDYTCGNTTYEGHAGSDYSLRGGNAAINNGNDVIAAAAGVVTVASDGNYDQCTECGGDGCGTNTPGGGFSNYVVVDHGTHNTTYGHLRNGSVAVSVGDTVDCGQVIGQIGSSGCSTGAHLHFQPRLSGEGYMNAWDPYQGDCSPTEASLWGEQGPYRGLPGFTCDGDPGPECPSETSAIWTCSADGKGRRRCVAGVDSSETCEWGCEVTPAEVDDVCALPPDEDDDGVRADTDCDDSRGDVHPGAVEICGDGIDQDCTGSDRVCPPEGTGGMLASGGAPSTGGVPTGGVPTGGATTGGALSSGGSATGGVVSGGEVATGGAVVGGTPSAGGSGTSPGASNAGASGGSASSDREAASDEDSGCACRLHRSATGHGYGWYLVAGLGLGLARRRVTAARRGRRVGPSPGSTGQ